MIPPSAVLRFFEKFEVRGECWIWTGGVGVGGYGGRYGQLRISGEGLQRAHRISYRIFWGAIPPDSHVDHMCHEKLCVHPGHLRLATSKQNQENRSGPNINNTSGYRGVSWHKRDRKWMAQVRHHGKRLYAGYFDDPAEAAEAAAALRLKLFTHTQES